MMHNWVKIPDDWSVWTFNKHGRAVPEMLSQDKWPILIDLNAKHRVKGSAAYFVFDTDEEAIMFKLTHL